MICSLKLQSFKRCLTVTKAKVSSLTVCLLSTLPKTNRIKDVLDLWQKTLSLSSLSEPSACVEYIVAHTLGKKTLYDTNLDDKMTDAQVVQVDKLCKLCQKGMPVQYVLGEWDFQDLTLKLKPPVLIPRPETEELADLCCTSLHECQQSVPQNSVKLLEVGCGSGALSVCLLKRFQELQAVAVDISAEACKLTSENAATYGVQERLSVIHGDFHSERVIEKLKSSGLFHLLVSNPPYVTTAEMEDLQPEIKWFEDSRALHGGEDGLDLIRTILQQASALLVSGGHIWLEVGLDHPEEIKQLLTKYDQYRQLAYCETAMDFTGRGRFCHLMSTEDLKR